MNIHVSRVASRIILLALILALWGCERPSPDNQIIELPPFPLATPTLASTSTPQPTSADPAESTTTAATPANMPTATPWFSQTAPDCGQILPILSDFDAPLVTALDPDAEALAAVHTLIPDAARPALNRLLVEPGTVGLAAYRVGQEEQGTYLNADAPMPLASVVKVIHLVAYAEAVAAGQIDPTETVSVKALAAYYLPSLDLGAHRQAIADLEADGRLFGNPPAFLLTEIPAMMIEYSSNAATDYLHMRLGQTMIEETAVSLGLSSQTAPCPFLGQFLTMANHIRTQANDFIAIQNYIDDPASYGRDTTLLTEAFSSDAAFRQLAIDWRRDTRRPNGQTQRFFSDNLNAQGSARDYAALMARIAQNGLSDADSSFIARRNLEWIMRFPANQELFSNAGYKNGSLPGILTTVYYAYPLGETTPVVIALFYRELNGRIYQDWRRNLTHDEFARWLLSDPAAIPALRAILN